MSDIITNDFNKIISANKQNIVLTKNDTVKEWIFSKSAKNLRLNNQNYYEDKIRAFKNIDELLTAANNWISEKAKHYHFKEFARGKVDFKVGVNGYTADIIVGINSNNIAILYDLVNITDKKITEANKTIHSQSRASRNIASVINNISEEHGNVKKFSQRNISNRDSEGNELTKEQQEYFKDSKVRDEDGNLKVISVVILDDEYMGRANGMYSPFANEIIIRKGLRTREKELKKTLIHEIQHAVQNIEGFKSGSNGSDKNYSRTAGEIESRDVESRLDFDAEERKNTRPDIDRTDVVFSDGDVSYLYVGLNKEGIENYETSEETIKLSWNERKKKYIELLENDFIGRTARFKRNGHVYYAQFDKNAARKTLYGEKDISFKGKKALINVGAEGDIFDVVENSEYFGSSADDKNHKLKDSFTDYFDYFFKTVQIDNNVFDLIINVKKRYKDKSGYTYTIKILDNKKMKASPAKTDKQPSIGQAKPSDNIIRTNEAKSQDKNSQRNTLSEAALLNDEMEAREKERMAADVKRLNSLNRFGEGKVIHAWDKVRIDDYLDIEKMTAVTGDHPKYIGWVPVTRVLAEEAH